VQSEDRAGHTTQFANFKAEKPVQKGIVLIYLTFENKTRNVTCWFQTTFSLLINWANIERQRVSFCL
jgi:hypothetical protein